VSGDDDGPLAVGLCTVTYRALDVEQVAALAAGAGVSVLEWGGDIHVPEGDLAAARTAASRSADHGLDVASYGSYLFLDDHLDRRIGPVVATAVELGAPAVRIWCPPVFDAPGGSTPGDGSDGDGAVAFAALVDAAGRAVEAATDAGLVLYLEFHGGGATASAAATADLLGMVPGLWTGWQPPYWAPRTVDEEVADLAVLRDRLLHVDVYQWDSDGTRRPIASALESWSNRLRAAAESVSAARRADLRPGAFIEFVPDDDPTALAGEVAALRSALAP